MAIRAVHHLNCATMCPIAGGLLGLRAGALGLGRGRMIAHCVVLETDRDDLVLIDTGFGTADCEHATGMGGATAWVLGPALDRAETAAAQITALGFAPADVRHIVVTHLDLDHAGGIADFPGAAVHVHDRELEAARARATANERSRYLPAQLAHDVHWESYREDGDTWRGLPAVVRLRGLDEDIGLVPMHGHTRGHSAVIARHGAQWLVHAGDAYFHHHALTGGKIPLGLATYEKMMQVDGRARTASVAALRQLHASYPDITMFSAHDVSEFEALASPPATARSA